MFELILQEKSKTFYFIARKKIFFTLLFYGLKINLTYHKKMSNNNYIDPPDQKELITEFLSLETTDQIKDFINLHLPGWLIASTDRYTVDYPDLQKNWQHICDMNSVQPQKIVIVDDIIFDNDHSFMLFICEAMTRKGYVVRKKEELFGCEECGYAMPCKTIWRKFKDRGVDVPRVWKTICSVCEHNKNI